MCQQQIIQLHMVQMLTMSAFLCNLVRVIGAVQHNITGGNEEVDRGTKTNLR